MNIHFYKYQGTGNDFIVLDNRKELYGKLKPEQIAKLCNRRFGIGADGLMLLQEKEGYDFEMVYFNANGKEGSMCGNGGRCLVKFAFHLGIGGTIFNFLAVDGPHEASVDVQEWVHLKMNDVEEIELMEKDFFLDTGSPHFVRPVIGLDELDVIEQGKLVRHNDRFDKEGVNVNFVEAIDETTIKVRTFERGVEDETFSCGTGVTAAALAFSQPSIGKQEIAVETTGGELAVSFYKAGEHHFQDIWLRGPAEKVFEGTIDLKES